MEQLFGSKTRVKLLQLFMQNPNRAYFVREITRKIEEQINSVRRELANLLNIGILKSRSKENRLYYEADPNFEHFDALRAVFAGAAMDKKVTDANEGMNTELADKLKALGSVNVLAYMGKFTNDDKAGVDLLIVGNVNKTNVNNFVADLEDEEGFEVRYAVLTLDQFNYRKSVQDRFISLVEESKKNVTHDPEGILSGVKPDKKKAKKKGK